MEVVKFSVFFWYLRIFFPFCLFVPECQPLCLPTYFNSIRCKAIILMLFPIQLGHTEIIKYSEVWKCSSRAV